METVKTDVLIIGSEGGGARAAIQASEAGVDVTVVTKGRLGRHGATVMAAADIAVDSGSLSQIIGKGNPADSPRTFLEDMVIEGKWLNDQTLAWTVAEEVPERLKELLEWGLNYTELRQMPGHRYPRSLYTSGLEMARTLSRQVRRRNIHLLEDTFVYELLTRDGEAIGAIGLDLRSGEPVIFSAKAVILAAGGCHSIYLHNTGASGLTGDGHAMACRAGAELVNMEMTQFIPTSGIESSPAHDSLFLFLMGPQNALRVWLLNKYGERFMSRWDPVRMEHTTRDLISIAIMTEILEGRGGPGGGVYYSLAHLPKNLVMDFARWGAKPFLKANWTAHGVDFTPVINDLAGGKAVEVVPAFHFFMGGIKINECCETSIPGLYAAGEIAGGVHGANRLSGTAFSQMLVLGRRAGISAAERAKNISARPRADAAQVSSLTDKLFNPIRNKAKVNPFEVKRRLQTMAWRRVGPVREGMLLKETLAELDRIKRDEIPRMASRSKETCYNLEWLECLQVENALAVLELIAGSALAREESRGAHFRKDFPETDNRNWLQNTTVHLNSNKADFGKQPVALKLVKP